MATLVVFQPDQRSSARITEAVGQDHALVDCPGWSALWDTLRRKDVDGCIVDRYAGGRRTGGRELLKLRRRRPPLALVVCSDFRDRETDLFELGRLEIDAVILAGQDERPRTIRESVSNALASAVARRVVDAVEDRLSGLGLGCLRWAIERAHAQPTGREFAEAFSLTPKTLNRRLREAGLPTPKRFLLWGRLFRAAQLLDCNDCSVERAAFAVGYSSRASLARAFRRQTGYPPTEVLRRGGILCVLAAFLRHRSSGDGRYGSSSPSRGSRWSSPRRPVAGRS